VTEKPSSTKKEKEITSEKEERDQKEPFGMLVCIFLIN
jgi:hypothetical protein